MKKVMDGEQKEMPEQGGGGLTEKVGFRDKNTNLTEQPTDQEKRLERREGVFEKDSAYQKILSQLPSKSSVSNDKANVSADAKNISAETDYESKIIKLVAMAEHKGLVHAVKVAKHLEDNYVLDELHDRLLGDDLHAALVEKGIIKEL